MHEMRLHLVSQIEEAAEMPTLQDHALGQGNGKGRLQTLRCGMGTEGRRDAEILSRMPLVDVEQREEDLHLPQVRQDPQPPLQQPREPLPGMRYLLRQQTRAQVCGTPREDRRHQQGHHPVVRRQRTHPEVRGQRFPYRRTLRSG